MNVSKLVSQGLLVALTAGGMFVWGTGVGRVDGRPPWKQPERTLTGAPGEEFDWEGFLRAAKIVSVTKDIAGGRTRPWIVVLDDGKTRRRALFKHLDYRRPRPAPDSYQYELAAYELAKLLGLDIVPPLVERVIDGTRGSLQAFLENSLSERDRLRKNLKPPDPAAHARFLEGLKVFEALVNDECGDLDDTWIEREGWRVRRVDFSEAFFPAKELPRDCEMTVCPRPLYEGLLRLEDGAVSAALARFLNREEIEALLIRKQLIIERIGTLIAEKGEGAVLY